MSEVAPVKAIIQAITSGIKLAHRVIESASSESTATALQISESAPNLQRSLERDSQAIRDAYQQNVETWGEPFTKALVEDKTIQKRLKELKSDVRDQIDECQDFEDDPNSFDPIAFENIQTQAYKCSTDCIAIFKEVRDQLVQASLKTSTSTLENAPKDDRTNLTSMRQELDPFRDPETPPTPTEPIQIPAPSVHGAPVEPVKPRSPWSIESPEFDMGPTLSGSHSSSLRRKPLPDNSPTVPQDGFRLISKEAVHSRINANEEFLDKRRRSRMMFSNELRYSTVSSISENRASEVFTDGPLSPLSPSPGTSSSPIEGRGFRASLNGYDMHITRHASQGHASLATRSSRASSILHDRQSPVERHDSEGSIFGIRTALATPPIDENQASGTSGNIELWTPITTTASPLVIDNPHTWDPQHTTNLHVPLPVYRGEIVSDLEPVSNLDFDDEKIAVNVPEPSPMQATPTFTVRQMDYAIRPDSSFSRFGGFCEGAKAVTRGEAGFKLVRSPVGQFSTAVSARCTNCAYEVPWKIVEKDKTLDKSGIYGNSGIRWRQRFISKCHLKVNSVETPKYACIFCIQAHKTVEEHDATIFFSVHQLFNHIAKHPQPVSPVVGITVLYGSQPPHIVDFDIHFPVSIPLVPEFPYAAIAQKAATRPSAQATASNHPKNDRTDSRDPDGNPVLHFAMGARIIGITFPERFNGLWCLGYHDGMRGAFPFSTIAINLPARDDEVMNSHSTLLAFAKWDFKLAKTTKESRWLKFSKGETISHIGYKFQDQWCWTGQNAKGQWGIFHSAFVDNLHDQNSFSPGPGSVKKSRMASLGLGRHKSRNEQYGHGRKTSIRSTSSGGSSGGNTIQPGLEVVASPVQAHVNSSSSFGVSSFDRR